MHYSLWILKKSLIRENQRVRIVALIPYGGHLQVCLVQTTIAMAQTHKHTQTDIAKYEFTYFIKPRACGSRRSGMTLSPLVQVGVEPPDWRTEWFSGWGITLDAGSCLLARRRGKVKTSQKGGLVWKYKDILYIYIYIFFNMFGFASKVVFIQIRFFHILPKWLKSMKGSYNFHHTIQCSTVQCLNPKY